ncbi:MAG TPA: hypothetical protein VNO22_18200 [Planctomycetota bacterium]|nr:hypothetical protein [Planctomycetota bacterium]
MRGAALRLPGSGDQGSPADRKDLPREDFLLKEEDAFERMMDPDVSGTSFVSSPVVLGH